MAQHFLLSARARTLSLSAALRMTETEAEAAFRSIRWAATDGKPVCPHCECAIVYEAAAPERRAPVSVQGVPQGFQRHESGTLFAFHKMPLRNYLAAIAIFCNEVKGKSALALSRDLGLQYKTAFVLAHKMREAMASELKGMTVGGPGRPSRRRRLFRRLREAGQLQREPPGSAPCQEPEWQAPGCG